MHIHTQQLYADLLRADLLYISCKHFFFFFFSITLKTYYSQVILPIAKERVLQINDSPQFHRDRIIKLQFS